MAEARDVKAAATAVPGGAPLAGRTALAGRRFVASWSGGKDAYLALQRAVAAGGRPAALLCTLDERGEASRGHGLPVPVLEAQAAALGARLVTCPTSWEEYETMYVQALVRLRGQGIEAGVFGDIDLQEHRDWVERVCAAAGLSCHLPLWHEDRRVLLGELLAGGVRATVIAVDQVALGEHFLGRVLDQALVAELDAAGVDLCGEGGEYHTAITAAPLFSSPVPLAWDGHEERDGHWVLRYCTAARPPGAPAPAAP